MEKLSTTKLPERALIVDVQLQNDRDVDRLVEIQSLAETAEISTAERIRIRRNKPSARYFIGNGKALEIAEKIKEQHIDLVIFSAELSPSQGRNLEQIFCTPVVDRTDLILDIFAKRARSFEGKLQVELAQLQHLSTRLIRGWTHLERQKGGLGLRGPGETQLETDRRLIGKRIQYLKKRLKKVRGQQNLGRRFRTKNQTPVVALVGYTNAGKSSIFNRLTAAQVYADDKLFATLDVSLKRFSAPALGRSVLVDTVGFIQNLPYDLVAAFQSTLDESRRADLLLHIVDAADESCERKIAHVSETIDEIGAANIPKILVMNKIDRLSATEAKIERDENGRIYRVWVSAKNPADMDLVVQSVCEMMHQKTHHAKIRLSAFAAHLRREICRVGKIENEEADGLGRWRLEIVVSGHYLEWLVNRNGVELLWEKNLPSESPI